MTAPSVMADMGRRDSAMGFSGPSETFGTRFGDDDGDGQISGEELARMQGKTYNPNSTVKQVLRMTEKTMPGDIGHLASTGTAEGQSIWNRMARIIQIRDLDLRILMDAHDRRNRGFVEISTFRRSLCYAFGNQWIDLAMSSKEFDEIVQPYLTRRPERPGEPEACVMWQRFANDVQALADTGKRTKNFLDRLEKVERDEKMRRTLADRYAPRAILAQFWRNSAQFWRNSSERPRVHSGTWSPSRWCATRWASSTASTTTRTRGDSRRRSRTPHASRRASRTPSLARRATSIHLSRLTRTGLWHAAQGARVYTFFMYLSTPAAGGGTKFNDLGVVVPAVKGSAVMWPSISNRDPSRDEPQTNHEALPVEDGMKYASNVWLHMYDYRTPADAGCLLTHKNTH